MLHKCCFIFFIFLLLKKLHYLTHIPVCDRKIYYGYVIDIVFFIVFFNYLFDKKNYLSLCYVLYIIYNKIYATSW
jgi:hypothetical protein